MQTKKSVHLCLSEMRKVLLRNVCIVKRTGPRGLKSDLFVFLFQYLFKNKINIYNHCFAHANCTSVIACILITVIESFKLTQIGKLNCCAAIWKVTRYQLTKYNIQNDIGHYIMNIVFDFNKQLFEFLLNKSRIFLKNLICSTCLKSLHLSYFEK